MISYLVQQSPANSVHIRTACAKCRMRPALLTPQRRWYKNKAGLIWQIRGILRQAEDAMGVIALHCQEGILDVTFYK